MLIAMTLAFNPASAQAVRCAAHRVADGEYLGGCARGDTAVGRVRFLHPTSSAPHLWRGRGFFSDSTSPGLALDVRQGGALQFGREWLAVTIMKHDSLSLEFAFSPDKPLPPSRLDADILRHAREYLSDASHWNSADSTDMAAAPTQGFNCRPTVARSMFCALYLSSIAVAGDYAHFRPAINAVRQAINAASRRRLLHPLVDFNNEPTTTLKEVQGVLDAAAKLIESQRKGAR